MKPTEHMKAPTVQEFATALMEKLERETGATIEATLRQVVSEIAAAAQVDRAQKEETLRLAKAISSARDELAVELDTKGALLQMANHEVEQLKRRLLGHGWNYKYSGDLWLDGDGTANFKFHIEGGDFTEARHALEKFIACLQDKLRRAEECPYSERVKNHCGQCGKDFYYSYEGDVCPACFGENRGKK